MPDLTGEPAANPGPTGNGLVLRRLADAFCFLAGCNFHLLVLVGILITLFTGYHAATNQFDYDLRDLMGDDPIAFDTYQECLTLFGPDDDIVVALPIASLTPEVFEQTLAVRRQLRLPGIDRIVDLATIAGISSFEDLDKLRERPRRLARVWEDIRANPLVRGFLLGRGEQAHLLVIRLKHLPHRDQQQLVRDIRARLSSLPGLGTFHLAGYPVFAERYVSLMIHENTLFLVLAVLTAIALSRLLLGSFLATVLVTGAVVFPTIWTQGLFALLGFRISLYSTLLSPMVLFVALSLATQFLARCTTHDPLAETPEALREIMRAAVPPGFLCALTTVLGFSTQLLSNIRGVRAFGLLSSLGCGLAFLSVYILLPAAWYRYRRHLPAQELSGRVLGRFLTRVLPGNRAVLVLVSFALAVSFAGCTRLHLGSDPLAAFPEDDRVVIDHRFVAEVFGGSGRQLSLVLKDRRQPFDRLESAGLLHRLGQTLASHPVVVRVLSPATLVSMVETQLSGGHRTFPVADQGVVRDLRLCENLLPDLLSSVINPPFFDRARLAVTLNISSSVAVEAFSREVEEICRRPEFQPLTASVTGRMHLSARMETNALAMELVSFLFSLAGVMAVIAIGFRSLKSLLIAFVANVLPVFLSLGALGWLGVSLDPATAMVPGLAIGLIVDDTIHLLHESFLERRKGHHGFHLRTAVWYKLSGAVVATAGILIAGLGLLMFSRFGPLQTFGGFAACTIFIAVFCDLLLTPALFQALFPREVPAPAGETKPPEPDRRG